MTQTVEPQEENEDLSDVPPLVSRVREPDDLPEPMAEDVEWPAVDDANDDMPIAAQYARDMSVLMAHCDEALERIETLYRNGIREIRELVRGS